jgi:hypothetical protein
MRSSPGAGPLASRSQSLMLAVPRNRPEMAHEKEVTGMAKGTSQGAVAIGPWLVVFGGLLLLGLGALGMRNMFSGVVLQPPAILGEWQAYRAPWRLRFDEDKALVSSTGPSAADETRDWASTPGTYRIDFFGTLWVELKDGRKFTAALRPELPNQFDLVDTGTDVVTVFERVRHLPPLPGDLSKGAPAN